MKSLKEVVASVLAGGSYDSSTGVYAVEPHSVDSPARLGDTQFDGGGLLDGMVFFADNVMIIDAGWLYCDGDPRTSDFGLDEVADYVIEEMNR